MHDDKWGSREETPEEKAARERYIDRNERMTVRATCGCRKHDALTCSKSLKRCGCKCHPPADTKKREWDLGAGRKTIDLDDYRRLAPALAAHEAEWISAGKLRECIARWLAGADFTDPAQREWEGHHPAQTAKEEYLELLGEAFKVIESDHNACRAFCAGADGQTTCVDGCDLGKLVERIRKALEREKL